MGRRARGHRDLLVLNQEQMGQLNPHLTLNVEDTFHNQNLHESIHSVAESTKQKGGGALITRSTMKLSEPGILVVILDYQLHMKAMQFRPLRKRESKGRMAKVRSFGRKTERRGNQKTTDTGDSLSF